ncbi:MAG: hypothetical protein K2P50_02805, partial [Lachnospiraceae bacterium]|nr:hypothetical protein [Lachnospiraceae bacterium]
MSLKISKLFVEYQEQPLGLDEAVPRFSWLLTSTQQNVLQSACQIQVLNLDAGGADAPDNYVWDSGKLDTGVSTGIAYGGPSLTPCTSYQVNVTVWDNYGNSDNASSFFETGLMDETGASFGTAQWIGAPRYTVCAENRGVFILETELAIPAGKGRAGVVFG